MQLPKVGQSYAQERRGIAAIQGYAATFGQIWRETDTGDVGIDGQLEYVNGDGCATGRCVAVQVKAGPSYFRSSSPSGWKFYPEQKHRNYWESFPLSVMLVLHDVDANASYWVDIRQALRATGRKTSDFIEVPMAHRLQETDPLQIFETSGVQGSPFIADLQDLLTALVRAQSKEASFPVSYFDLFTNGLTNICRSIYYGIDLVKNVAEMNLAYQGCEWGVGMGHPEHAFAFDFVKFLLAQNLAQVDYSDCLIDWVDREMHPHFVAPLTSRGRALVALIHEEENRLMERGVLPIEGGLRVAQEGQFAMTELSYFGRLPRIRAFREIILSERAPAA